MEEVQSALNQSMTDNFQPTLAVVFLSKRLDGTAIAKLFDAATIEVFGLTTNGELIDETTEHVSAARSCKLPAHSRYVFKVAN